MSLKPIRPFVVRTVAAQLHLVGFIAAAVGLVALARVALIRGGPFDLWACLIFSLSGMFVFAASTLCHFMADGFGISQIGERRFEQLDQISIFFFIAGTYTPVILNVISAPWDQILIYFIWTFCLIGVFYTLFRESLPAWARHRYANTSIYVLMGWTLVIRGREAFENITHLQGTFLVAGGLTYTVGALIYAFKRPDPFPGIFGYHEVWHCTVLLGSAFHFMMIYSFYS